METTSPSQQRSILVIGSGIIGLTSAYVLSENKADKITIVARESVEHLFSQAWASPWAGADWSPMDIHDERQWRWEKTAFEKFWSMIPSGMTMALSSKKYVDSLDALSAEPKWRTVARDFQSIPKEELPEGYAAGLSFTTLSVKPALYLPWLVTELKARGVTFIHRAVGSIEEAAAVGGEDCIVVNATGLGAKSLLGVADQAVFPIRGQTIFINAPNVKQFISASQGNTSTYVIPRPDGTVTCGGTFQEDNADLSVDYDTAKGIYERCTAFVPELRLENGTKIISHNVGLRPARRGGPRVELETVQLPLQDVLIPDYGLPRPHRVLKVVHAYGLGPAGYQTSWGVAEDVAALVQSS